jgi:enoyl-CoA hydratase
MAFIRTSKEGDTLIVTFARAPANAFNLALIEELAGCFEAAAAEPPSGGLVVIGDGAVFSGGVDFKEAPRYTAEEKRRMVQGINRMITALFGIPCATVAAVNGHAIGGGFVVMLACDARLGVPSNSKLALSEVAAGIPYPACPMEIVKAELAPDVRRRLVLSGDPISPAEAHALGIVDELVAADRLMARAVELARTRSALPAYARVKEHLKRDTLQRMRAIVAGAEDPILKQWV